ncbi:hypothetical protein TRIP_B330164 [uncultured Desulfatiglans sp.]|uniref:Uncharacterized protein n=1 Tax=Uncultured Desulfatiglans sp. TaxID=1748965 RepID=A0A653A7F0_UNCDX|nr:hypothetical protein TRIP_B330164 [uncultured Desulfatiglans sp.]
MTNATGRHADEALPLTGNGVRECDEAERLLLGIQACQCFKDHRFHVGRLSIIRHPARNLYP